MQDLHHLKTSKKAIVEEPPKKSHLKLFFIVFAILFTIVAIFYFLLSANSSWDGKSKILVASEDSAGIVTITVLDPGTSSISYLVAPAEVEVNAANNLGTWKLGSISKLGNDKNLGGIFLKNTLIKSFNFPITDWSGPDFIKLTNGNILSELSTFFKPDISNLSVFDKLRMANFAIAVNANGKITTNLEDTSELSRAKLTDGSLGWTITDNIPTSVESFLVDTNLASKNLNVLINDYTSTSVASGIVTKTVEALGANVASIQNMDVNKSLDCKITGQTQAAVDKIAKIFSCDKSYSKAPNNFDIQIDIGEIFRNRF